MVRYGRSRDFNLLPPHTDVVRPTSWLPRSQEKNRYDQLDGGEHRLTPLTTAIVSVHVQKASSRFGRLRLLFPVPSECMNFLLKPRKIVIISAFTSL